MNQVKPYQKTTTLTKSPGCAQVAAYLIFALMVGVFYAVVVPNLENPTAKYVFLVLFSLSLTIMFITTFLASQDDPSDQTMILYRNSRSKFDEWKLEHIGKLLYCDYCESFVKEKSRHCKNCNRCVQNFDHHCMWINNCVGSSNYNMFFAMSLSTFTTLVIYLSAIGVLTAQRTYDNYLVGFIFGWLSGSIDGVFAFLLLNLIILHIYLMSRGISTYEFIVAQREEERRKKFNDELKKKVSAQSHKTVIPEQICKKIDEDQSSQANFKDKKSMKNIQHMNQILSHETQHQHKMVRVRDSQLSSSSQNDNIIFGEKEDSHKSEHSDKHSGAVSPDKGSDSDDSVRVSQVFTRNKSLKLILGKNQYYRPKSKRSMQRLKMHSMIV